MDLGAALGAAPEVSAKGFGPTGHEVGDGAPMRRQHQRAMDLQVVVAEAAEHVRDFDHDRVPESKAGHDLVEEGTERRPGGFGQMGIKGRGRDIGMAQEDLDHPGVDAVLQQPGRVTVTQGVRRRPTRQADLLDRGREAARQHGARDRLGAVVIGKQPLPIAVFPPHDHQLVEYRLRQRHQPLLVALADNAQDHPRTVDRADMKRSCLRNPEAACIHQREAAPMSWVADYRKKLPHLGIGEGIGQALLLWFPYLFFPNNAQSQPSVSR